MVSTTTTIIVITTITTTTTVTQAGQQRGSVPYLVLKFLDESCSISNKDCQSTTYQYLMHTLGTHDMYDGLHDGTLLNHWPPHRRQETRCGRSNKRLRGGIRSLRCLNCFCRPIDIHATGISAASSPRGVRCL